MLKNCVLYLIITIILFLFLDEAESLLEIVNFVLVASSDDVEFSFHVHLQAAYVLIKLVLRQAFQIFWQRVLLLTCILRSRIYYLILFSEVLLQIVVVDIVNVHVLDVLHEVWFFLSLSHSFSLEILD